MEAPEHEQLYRAKEFAQKAGVTVRTLHFYDRLGLLVPSARTPSGYRLYTQADLDRLEQILALRFIRFGLDRIKALLSGSPQPLAAALEMQREIVAEERRRIDQALQAIERAQDALRSNDDEKRWKAVHHVIEAFKMKDDHSWTEKYYSPEDLDKLAATREKLGPQGMQKAQQDWADLIAEVEAAAKNGEDPAGERAQSLSRRWSDLIAQFTQNDPGVSEGLNKVYKDQQNWPQTFKRPWSDDAQAFLEKARTARQ